ncbi:MAG: histidine phosphatase family protein [Rhodospirillales bacterium]|nr:histidine phosphatase family protein [Rhodospirillales bacterium]
MLLIRHGQSHFNNHFVKTRVDPGIVDPRLTEEGRRQIRAATERLIADGQRVTRLLSSPYWRALETAEILAEALDITTEVEPLVSERAFFVCDIGSPRSELKARFPAVDFRDLAEEWWRYPDESERELMQRCFHFRSEAVRHPAWPETLVVSHWGFIRGLTGRSVENAAVVRHDPTFA